MKQLTVGLAVALALAGCSGGGHARSNGSQRAADNNVAKETQKPCAPVRDPNVAVAVKTNDHPITLATMTLTLADRHHARFALRAAFIEGARDPDHFRDTIRDTAVRRIRDANADQVRQATDLLEQVRHDVCVATRGNTVGIWFVNLVVT
jgi:hypothetical protein